jgi:hypothetical protein
MTSSSFAQSSSAADSFRSLIARPPGVPAKQPLNPFTPTRLTIVILELHLLGNRIIHLLILVLTPPQAQLALGDSRSTSGGRSDLFGRILRSPVGAVEKVRGRQGGSTDSCEVKGGV